jgi:hypothetical protein
LLEVASNLTSLALHENPLRRSQKGSRAVLLEKLTVARFSAFRHGKPPGVPTISPVKLALYSPQQKHSFQNRETLLTVM